MNIKIHPYLCVRENARLEEMLIEQIYQWVKNIAFYLILITAVMNVLPNNNYKKYVKLFTGMVLVLLVLSPITSLLKLNRTMDFTFMTSSFEQELNELDDQAESFEYAQKSRLFTGYEEEVAKEIGEVVEQDGLYPVDIQVVMEEDESSEDYGSIRQIHITAAYSQKQAEGIYIEPVRIGTEEKEEYQPESMEEINIKNDLERFYNISASNININIQR